MTDGCSSWSNVEAPAFIVNERRLTAHWVNLGARGIGDDTNRRRTIDAWRDEQRLLTRAGDDNRAGSENGSMCSQALSHHRVSLRPSCGSSTEPFPQAKPSEHNRK